MTSKSRMAVLMAVALTLSFVVAGPAVGGPDCDNPKFADHPTCSDTGPVPDHPDGATCEATGDSHGWITATDDFTVVLPDKLLCVDWTTTKATAWRFTATTEGRVQSVSATVRDSHPGDFCWNDGSGEFASAPTVSPILPAAAIDACGTEYTDLGDPTEAAIPYVLNLFHKSHRTAVITVTVEAVD